MYDYFQIYNINTNDEYNENKYCQNSSDLLPKFTHHNTRYVIAFKSTDSQLNTLVHICIDALIYELIQINGTT